MNSKYPINTLFSDLLVLIVQKNQSSDHLQPRSHACSLWLELSPQMLCLACASDLVFLKFEYQHFKNEDFTFKNNPVFSFYFQRNGCPFWSRQTLPTLFTPIPIPMCPHSSSCPTLSTRELQMLDLLVGQGPLTSLDHH